MTAIKAIETRYRGYRFRSRLEARWAVFFDRVGVKWEYEPQGFDLGPGLGPYLPDFWLPEYRHWVEVKPESSRPAAHRLYLAGKITGDDWRDAIVPGGRVSTVERLWSSGFDSNSFRIPGTPHDYVGPFKLGVDDHGGSLVSGDYDPKELEHGLELLNTEPKAHSGPNRPLVLRNCLSAIDAATVVFAWVNCTSCFATFAEIGYARRAGKVLCVGFDRLIGQEVIDDMWFLGSCASACGVYDTATQSFEELIGRHDEWLPLDHRKAKKLSEMSGKPCEIVCGDPLSHYEVSVTPHLYRVAPQQKRDAMAAARAARFEHGETPEASA